MKGGIYHLFILKGAFFYAPCSNGALKLLGVGVPQ